MLYGKEYVLLLFYKNNIFEKQQQKENSCRSCFSKIYSLHDVN